MIKFYPRILHLLFIDDGVSTMDFLPTHTYSGVETWSILAVVKGTRLVKDGYVTQFFCITGFSSLGNNLFIAGRLVRNAQVAKKE